MKYAKVISQDSVYSGLIFKIISEGADGVQLDVYGKGLYFGNFEILKL